MTDRKERCETCRWWKETRLPDPNDIREGTCKAHPPQMVWQELPGFGEDPAWAVVPERPQMDFDDFCGEWVARNRLSSQCRLHNSFAYGISIHIAAKNQQQCLSMP